MTAAIAVSKAVEAAAKEASEAAGKWLLGFLVDPGLAVPTAKVAAAAVAALAGEVVKQSSKIEKKLDRLLEEPWRTGSRGVLEALELPAATAEELERRDRRVEAAIAKLEEARSLAEQAEDRELLEWIAGLQALAYAALPGGEPSAAERLSGFRRTAEELRGRASAQEASSARPVVERKVPPGAGAAWVRRNLESGVEAMMETERPPTPAEIESRRADAAELRRQASELDRFCALVRALAAARR